jgi:hypothetical protein
MVGVMSAKDYEGLARDIMRLACETSDPATREELIEMAREWMGRAMDERPPDQAFAPSK